MEREVGQLEISKTQIHPIDAKFECENCGQSFRFNLEPKEESFILHAYLYEDEDSFNYKEAFNTLCNFLKVPETQDIDPNVRLCAASFKLGCLMSKEVQENGKE